MNDNEPDDIYLVLELSSSTSSSSSKSSTDSDEEEEVPLNQEIPRIAETNSVTGSSQDLNGNGLLEPSTSRWRSRPSTSSDDDRPMETIREDASPTSEGSDEDIPTVQRSNQVPLHSISGLEPSCTVTSLYSRAEAFIDELLRSLPPSETYYPPPPGRLPVSISPKHSPAVGGIQIKINLKNRTSSIVQGGGIPDKFRNENVRNKGLPTMDVSEESIRGWFDQACRHIAFFVTRFIAVMDDVKVDDEEIHLEEFTVAFELFQREFLDFDEMVTFALERLSPLVEPDVINALNERHNDVKNKYWKLEIAFLTGRLKDQESYISHVSEEIKKVLEAIGSIYTKD